MQCCSLTTMFCRTGGIEQGKQSFFLILKRNLKESPTDPKMADDDAVDPDHPQRGHPSSVMPTYLYLITE